MRRKRTRHPNYTPAVCMGVCALLLVWALGLLLHRCSARALEAVSGLILATVTGNGIPEAIVALIAVTAIGKALLRVTQVRTLPA